MDWKPYLNKIDVILEKKSQAKLSEVESSKLISAFEARLTHPAATILAAHFPDMLALQLSKDLPNSVYDVLKASRGDAYK